MATGVNPGGSYGEMTSRRRRRRPISSPAAALEDDDLLAEILLRLPPQPSSLLRSSLACWRWRHLVRDPRFLRRFRDHHHSRGTPPVLGFFTEVENGISFHPTLEPPNRVPPGRFDLQVTGRAYNCRLLGCRDGLALLVNVRRRHALVWDPVTGEQRHLPIPLALRNMDNIYNGIVLRSAAIGDGDRFQFQVVLVRCVKGRYARALACVYSSDTGEWGDLVQISNPLLRRLSLGRSVALVGRSLYWQLHGNSRAILEFDLDRQNLAVIPLNMNGWVMAAEGGGLGFVSISCNHPAQLWKRETDSDGVTTWLLTKTIDLDKLLPLSSKDGLDLDFSEENNMLILGTISGIGIFTVHIESMQCKKLPVNFKHLRGVFQPFSSVYTAEMGVVAEHPGEELLHNR